MTCRESRKGEFKNAPLCTETSQKDQHGKQEPSSASHVKSVCLQLMVMATAMVMVTVMVMGHGHGQGHSHGHGHGSWVMVI